MIFFFCLKDSVNDTSSPTLFNTVGMLGDVDLIDIVLTGVLDGAFVSDLFVRACPETVTTSAGEAGSGSLNLSYLFYLNV